MKTISTIELSVEEFSAGGNSLAYYIGYAAGAAINSIEGVGYELWFFE